MATIEKKSIEDIEVENTLAIIEVLPVLVVTAFYARLRAENLLSDRNRADTLFKEICAELRDSTKAGAVEAKTEDKFRWGDTDTPYNK